MTATYSTLEEFMAAFPNGGSEGDVVTVGNVIYSWNPYAKNWHGASAGDAHMNLSAMVARGAYSSLSEVEEAYPNGGNAGDYVTVNGVVYLWNDQSNTWAYTGAVRAVSSGQQLAASATNNVGLYATLLDLWNAYPDGGQEGDYAMIGDAQATAIQYVWDEDLGLWMDTQNSSAGRLNYTFDGDATVGNNLYVGGVIHAKWLISPYDRLFQRLYAKVRTDIAGVVSDGDRANWNAAFGNMHVHANYSVLAGITAADIERWNAGGGGGVTPTPTPGGITDLSGYTWWGRPMPGTKTLNGALENVTNITMSGSIQMGGSITMPTGNLTMGASSQIKIGNAVISYESDTNSLKISNFSGGTMNLYATGGVSALGTGSSGGGGGGGGGDTLTQPLSSINTSGMSAPGPNEDGKTLVWDNTRSVWTYGDAGSATLGTLLENLKGISASPADGQMLVYRTNAWGYEDVPAFDEAAMWAALDATGEVIDASHIPALNYLPLTGGTINGNLTVTGKIHIGQYGYFENYNGVRFDLPDISGGPYTLATTADLDNYVSKSFFNRLFQAFNGSTPVTPNDTTTVIDNIKAMADFWSAGAVAALGTSSASGGGASLGGLLQAMNGLNVPSSGTYAINVSGNTVTLTSSAGNLAGVSVAQGEGIEVTQSGIPFTTAGTRTINIAPTWQTKINKGVTAEGWGNHASAGYAADNAVVHKAGAETITGLKTFENDIFLKKTGQQWIQFDNGNINEKVFSFGQESSGNCVLSSSEDVDFYTDISGNPYALYIEGSTGNVGMGTSTPAYKLHVAGDAYASGRIWSGLSIGAKTSETEGFRFEWDANNNAVVVVKANGTPCNFYSLGGVSALGVGSAGATPSISAMNITTLTATTATAATLNNTTINPINGYGPQITTPDGSYYVAFNYEQRNGHYVTDFYNVGLFGEDENEETWSIEPDGSAKFTKLKVGTGSVISNLSIANDALQITTGGNTYTFAASGTAYPFYYSVTQSGGTYTLSTTFANLQSAFNSRGFVVLHFDNKVYALTNVNASSSPTQMVFTYTEYNGSTLTCSKLTVTSSGVTHSSHTLNMAFDSSNSQLSITAS